MRILRAAVIVLLAAILGGCPPTGPTNGTDSPGEPPGPIGPVDGGVPEELAEMLLESIAAWEENYRDVPFGSTWALTYEQLFDHPDDDPIQHNKIELAGELSLVDEPEFPTDNPTPEDALDFYLTRPMSLVGQTIGGSANGTLQFRRDATHWTTENDRFVTDTTISSCTAPNRAVGYEIVGTFETSGMDIVFVWLGSELATTGCSVHRVDRTFDKIDGTTAVSYTHLTLPTTSP
mgnify:CR=1 FL=1